MTTETIEAPTAETTTTPPAIGQYWPGQGGIYCGVLPAIGEQPAQHLIVSQDEAATLVWGEYGKTVEGASSRHNGRGNTLALQASIKAGHAYPAAQWAAAYTADGHADFHLPSQAELFMASLHAPQVFDKDGWYWSSTQDSPGTAFAQDFEDGSSYWFTKGGKLRVRALRWIPLQTFNP